MHADRAAFAAELQHLEWELELDRRSWSINVPRPVAEAMEWGDVDSAAFLLGADMRVTEATAEPAPGLVSVPTSRKHSASAVQRRWQVTQLQQAINAFAPDKDQSRLMRLRRGVGFSARAHRVSEKAKAREDVLMLTLTYRPGVEWEPKHISACMQHIREWHRRRGIPCRYVWVAELQDGKRGGEGRMVIHYHIALWVPQGTKLPFADTQGWWPHGSTRTEVAKGAVQYLLHYLKKGDAKNYGRFPRGARIYGVGGLDHALRRARRWLGLPAFVQGNSSIHDKWTRAVGGGWRAPDGRVLRSEFERVFVGDGWCLRRVGRHTITGAWAEADGTPVAPSGPFSWLTDRAIALGSAL